jgi:hypothetical protein
MTTNPYFTPYENTNEQDLYEGMVIEAIQMHGIDMKYMPRELLNGGDMLWSEDPDSYFDKSMTIEGYINEVDGYAALQDLMGKTGMETAGEFTVIFAKRRWKEEALTQLQVQNDVPKEGSLLYIPYVNRVFQIERVKDQVGFNNFGKKYVYDLTISTYKYSHEPLNTGVDQVDNIQKHQDVNLDGIISIDEMLKAVPGSQNDYLQTEGNKVVSFDKKDPFSESGSW